MGAKHPGPLHGPHHLSRWDGQPLNVTLPPYVRHIAYSVLTEDEYDHLDDLINGLDCRKASANFENKNPVSNVGAPRAPRL